MIKLTRISFDGFLKVKDFGKNGSNGIERCVESSYFSILVNGTSKGFFKSSRDLRQGDPLSPFLFSLVTDGLSAILKKAKSAGLIQSFIMWDDSTVVSHLQFSYDTILFLDASKENIKNTKMCLAIFKVIVGLSINIDKSLLAGIHVEQSLLVKMVGAMGCRVGEWPLKYLGMPLGENPRATTFWDPVVEKFSKKLAIWKKSYISFGRMITLIKEALANLPVFYMSIFKMSCKVVSVLERLQRDFLWKRGGQKKDHLVK